MKLPLIALATLLALGSLALDGAAERVGLEAPLVGEAAAICAEIPVTGQCVPLCPEAPPLLPPRPCPR